MNDKQFSTPKGVVITKNNAEIPTYSLHPDLRTPLRRCGDLVDFVLLEQSTKSGEDKVLCVPDVLGINGDTQIGLSRAARIMQASQTSMAKADAPTEKKDCSFCHNTHPEGDRGAFSVDNARPFGPLVHKVVLSKSHIETIGNLKMDEFVGSTEQFIEIARNGSPGTTEPLDGLAIGMNFGKYALSGASQIHFHYQVAGLGAANYNAGDRLGALCEAYGRARGADYLRDYEIALRTADLIVAEAKNNLAFAYVPISPRFNGEVQVMLRRRQAGNILDTTLEERQALSELQYVIMRRFERLGCEGLNQVWYATRFSAKEDWGQRLIISLFPRAAVVAFYELFGNSVIDTLPWMSALTLREAESPNFGFHP